MTCFLLGQTVEVIAGPLYSKRGRVVSLRIGDGTAWVEMSTRHAAGEFPFPLDSVRANWTILEPRQCKEVHQ